MRHGGSIVLYCSQYFNLIKLWSVMYLFSICLFHIYKRSKYMAAIVNYSLRRDERNVLWPLLQIGWQELGHDSKNNQKEGERKLLIDLDPTPTVNDSSLWVDELRMIHFGPYVFTFYPPHSWSEPV